MKCAAMRWIFLPVLAICLSSGAARLWAQSPEDKALEVLKSPATVEQKCNACRGLKTAGTERSVPALAALLAEPDVSHAARVALESMPCPAAGAALREAATRTTGLVKSGLLDSLGERRDPLAVPVLVPALQDKDLQVVAAAATALGKIGTAEAADALFAARAKAQGEARTKISAGLLVGADRLLQGGQRDAAGRIYGALAQPGEPRVIRSGALRGVMPTAGSKPSDIVPSLRKFLGSDDPLVRTAAAGELPNLSLDNLRALSAGIQDLPVSSQAAILMALRVRGDRSLATAALQAVGSKDETVRLAAVKALGTVGDATALPILIELSAAKDKLGEAARQSLEAICGANVDEQIVAALRGEKQAARRVEWIGLLAMRRPAGVVPVLLGEAAHPDPSVRSRALAALAQLAGPKDVAAMVAVLLKLDKGQRDDAERAVRTVCLQIADADRRADPVLEILRGTGAAQRAELLPLLGRIGGAQPRQMIQEALGSKDPQQFDAGVHALANWPDSSVAEQLLRLAQSAEAEPHRLLALRAFTRVAVLPGKASDAEKLAWLQQAMQLARRDEDRAYVLERASAVRTAEAMRFLVPYLDQPPLAETAAKSVVELARHKELRQPNKKDFDAALEKVLKTSKDSLTVEKAQRLLRTS